MKFFGYFEICYIINYKVFAHVQRQVSNSLLIERHFKWLSCKMDILVEPSNYLYSGKNKETLLKVLGNIIVSY